MHAAESVRRVLLVDDHVGVRAALRSALKRDPAMAVVAEAGNGPEALQALEHTAVDAVVLDLSMEGGSGQVCLPALREALPDARIVVFSANTGQLAPGEAERLGADAVIAKHDGLAAIRAALG